ncbi:hypothetical protein GMMP15_1020006 [Candidatus Magnetomoraceae bacterium gMMP-15]
MNKIKKRILVPLGVVFVIFLSTSIFSIYWLQHRHITENVREAVDGVQQLFPELLKKEAKFMEVQIDFIKKDKNLQSAYLAKNRDALFNHALLIFKNICSKYNATHFYFMDINRICFLRVHNQLRHGDYIKRFTIDRADREKRTAYGIELGPFGTFTLRVVCPWYINGKLVGYIELGKEIEHITPELKKIFNVELIFIIEKFYLARAKWEEGLKMMGRTGDWDQFADFVIIDRTIKKTPEKLNKYINKHIVKHKKFLFWELIDNREYWGGFIPLIDASGIEVGDIVIMNDVTKVESEQRILLLIMLINSMCIGGMLFLFFYFYIGRIEQKFTKAHNDLKIEIKEREMADKALKESEEKLDNMLRSITDQISMVDKDLNILWANETTKKVFGNDIIGKKCYEAYHKFKKPCEPYPCSTLQAFQDGEVHECYTYAIGKDGKIIDLFCTANSALKDKDGKPTAVIKVSRDVTKIKQAEKELKIKNKDLEKFNKISVTRELKMIELKKEINILLEEFGKKPRYRIAD